MHRRKSNVAVLLLLAFLIAGCSNGCSWVQSTTKGFTDLTPKQKSTFFMGIYKKNFDETLALATRPTITEDEKKMVRVKKAVLVKMYPAIKAYDVLIVDNTATSAAKEAELLGLVDQLIAATIPKPATDNAGVK
jgi:PBP1b-binding outer membrane lipoprotein LpoB